jgi:hypothetical protein
MIRESRIDLDGLPVWVWWRSDRDGVRVLAACDAELVPVPTALARAALIRPRRRRLSRVLS